MITFFRSFDPVRLSGIFIIFFAFKLSLIIKGVPLLVPELSWMLVGEKLSDGATMYKDIWCQLEPLSAGFYYFIDIFFGRSQTAYLIINLILVFTQAVGFNFILNIGNVFNERTSLPTFIYLLYGSLFFDFNTLSPIIMGTTFILPAFNLLLLQIRVKEKQENLLIIGILSGVASLFYLSLSFFLVLVMLVMLLYSHVPIRLYLTLITGYLFPFFIIICYYYIQDAINPLFFNLFVPSFKVSLRPFISLPALVFIALPAIFMSLLALWMISERAKYINFQYQVLKVMGIWLLLASIFLLFVRNLEPFHIYAIVAPLAYLTTHYFLLIKNVWFRELPLYLLIGIVLFYNYNSINSVKSVFNTSAMIVPAVSKATYENKRVLVVGDQPSAYLKNSLATPYYNWNLALRHFNYLNNYHNLAEVYSNFQKDLPDVIIDQKNIIPKLFYKLPLLEEQYIRSAQNHIYLRRNQGVAENRQK